MVDPEGWTTSLGKLEQFAKREGGWFSGVGMEDYMNRWTVYNAWSILADIYGTVPWQSKYWMP